jgi:hypothetical protein
MREYMFNEMEKNLQQTWDEKKKYLRQKTK